MIVFLDASALFYLREGEASLALAARQALAHIAARHPTANLALSRLSWLECRVGPMKASDQQRLELFDAFFERPDLIWVELSRAVIERAADIRARFGLRTPDALQAASCLELGPQHCMSTGDTDFQRVPELNLVCLA